MLHSPLGRLVRVLVAAAAILAPTIFIASFFPLSLMLSPTTATGGDLASHNYAAVYERMLLVTRHRVTGWVPGNYGGFPLFQMYFPLPFVAIAALSALLDPNVAFKLISVLGLLALPAAAYFVVARTKTPFPGPAIAASLTLLFLFQTGNSMWGGNITSTLAGEFAFSISLPLALLYLGLLDDARPRAFLVSMALVALLCLTHAYTVLWIALTSGLVALTRPRPIVSLARLAVIYIGGGALCAFWLLPLLWYTPWTTAYSSAWVINSLLEVFPRMMWPAIAVAAASMFGKWRSAAPLYAGLLTAGVQFAAAPLFGVVDIRFLPFVQLSLCLLAASGAGRFLSRWPAPILWIPIVFLSAVWLVQPARAQIQAWVRWNYEGFESKPLWPVYRELSDYLRGDAAQPRVVYEHTPDNEALGTIRAFENLPLFSGRSTLEGVFMQASATSPFVFFIQSEISAVMSCPFGGWGCSRTNLPAGIEHLKMMNVSDFIVRSDTVKAAAAKQPNLIRRATFGPYELFQVVGGEPGYAVALTKAPYAVVTRDWKSAAYRWFKTARADDPVPVFVSDSRAAEDGRFTAPSIPLAEAPALIEHLEAERLTVSGLRPGQPLLIRISYHPRWRSTTGEPIWLAGPGFMLVFPEHDRLELTYAETWPTIAGTVVSAGALLGWLGAAILVFSHRAQRRRGSGGEQVHVTDLSRTQFRRPLYLFGLACLIFAVGVGIYVRRTDADARYRAAQRQYDAGEMEQARATFRRARAAAPLSNTAIHSTYYEAIILYRQERWDQSIRAFEQLLAEFPEAQAAAEATYHIGLCHERAGRVADAIAAFDATIQRFPETTWAMTAAEHERNLR